MSILDRFQQASIALFREKDIPNKDVSNIIKSDKTAASQPDRKTFLIGELDSVTCREMALRCPLFMKGSYKRNGDIFNNWFEIVDRKTGDPIGQQLQNIIDEFDDRVNIRDKMIIAGVCNDVYGDLILERTFMHKVEDKYVPLIEESYSPPDFRNEPLNINVINPEIVYKIDKRMGMSDTQEYYHCKLRGQRKYIHPDRIIHASEIRLPHSKFGASKVDIGYNIINSLLNTDQISGEILDWFSTGMYFMTKQGLTSDEQDAAIKQFKDHPRFIVVDDRYKMDVYNPTRVDPEPFYEHYYTKIAALFRMPRQLLIGAEVGAITGSEVGFADYVASIHNLREMYGGILTVIYKHLLKTKGHSWNYEIVWNKTYIDELSESKTMEKRALVATSLIDRKLITREEGRRIMNEGFVRLNVANPEGNFIEPNPNAQPMLPNVEPPTKPKGKPKKPEVVDDGGGGKQERAEPDIFEMKSGEREDKLQDKRLIRDKKE